jgi:hypothetical protein
MERLTLLMSEEVASERDRKDLFRRRTSKPYLTPFAYFVMPFVLLYGFLRLVFGRSVH